AQRKLSALESALERSCSAQSRELLCRPLRVPRPWAATAFHESRARGTPAKRAPACMLRLITFGGLSLVHDAAVLKSHTPRQRLLPLLALVAASGTNGMARGALAELLWPAS